MKLADFIKQTYDNTLYVSPDFGKPIHIRNTILFSKAEEIAKEFFKFGCTFNLKLINDLFHGLNILRYPQSSIDECDDPILRVDEIKPFINTVLSLNLELLDIIMSEDKIVSVHHTATEELKNIFLSEIYSFSHKLYQTLLKNQQERILCKPYQVFRELDFIKIYSLFEDYLYNEYQSFKFLFGISKPSVK
ncbi:MAG: hypothetical protein K1X85_14110 [Ignavibacteria bacterium]|nr:hypothetical protein [Ignavibacteria bacterium]